MNEKIILEDPNGNQEESFVILNLRVMQDQILKIFQF